MKRLTLPNSTKVVGISQTFSSTLAVKHDWSFCSSPAAHRLTNLVTGAVLVASDKLLPISTRPVRRQLRLVALKNKYDPTNFFRINQEAMMRK